MAPLARLVGTGRRAGLVLARTVWTTYLWLIPYALFWAWVLTVSTRMLRTRPAPTHADAGGQ